MTWLLNIFPLIGVVGKSLRLPMIAAFLVGLALKLAEWFARFTTTRASITAALLVVIGALTAVVFVSFNTMLSGINLIAPNGFAQCLALILPSNLISCTSLLISAHSVRWAWAWKCHFAEKTGG